MTRDQLVAQVEFEFKALHSVVHEIRSLLDEVGAATPDIRVSTVVGAFMQQFYNGIESVLKRLCLYHGVTLPEGGRYHADLLSLFGPSHPASLPQVLDPDLFADMEPFRQFRHVFRTSYGFQLDWSRFSPGAATAPDVLKRFEAAVRETL